MADEKKKSTGPDQKAVAALQSIVKNSQAANAKKKTDETDPGPEPLSNIHSVGDAYRIGKDRISRAIFGPPKKQ